MRHSFLSLDLTIIMSAGAKCTITCCNKDDCRLSNHYRYDDGSCARYWPHGFLKRRDCFLFRRSEDGRLFSEVISKGRVLMSGALQDGLGQEASRIVPFGMLLKTLSAGLVSTYG